MSVARNATWLRATNRILAHDTAAMMLAWLSDSRVLDLGVFLFVAYRQFQSLRFLQYGRTADGDTSFAPKFAALLSFAFMVAVVTRTLEAGKELALIGFMLSVAAMGFLNGILLILKPRVIDENYSLTAFRSKPFLGGFLVLIGTVAIGIVVNGLLFDPTAFKYIHLR